MAEINNPVVAEKFAGYPDTVKEHLLFLRELILKTAAELDAVGEVEETLKWGEPAYVSKAGSTIRIDWKEKSPETIQLYVHCQTSLIERFRDEFEGLFEFEGNRALRLRVDAALPSEALASCIAEALTYHLRKRSR